MKASAAMDATATGAWPAASSPLDTASTPLGDQLPSASCCAANQSSAAREQACTRAGRSVAPVVGVEVPPGAWSADAFAEAPEKSVAPQMSSAATIREHIIVRTALGAFVQLAVVPINRIAIARRQLTPTLRAEHIARMHGEVAPTIGLLRFGC